jgi:hypothetical protein
MKIQRFIFPYLEDVPKPEGAQIISEAGMWSLATDETQINTDLKPPMHQPADRRYSCA